MPTQGKALGRPCLLWKNVSPKMHHSKNMKHCDELKKIRMNNKEMFQLKSLSI